MDYCSIPSKFKGNRRKITPKKIVIHAIGEYLDASEDKDFHCIDYLDSIGLCAHFFITPTGTIIQSLNSNEMGSHAKGHNIDSIGIEFMVAGNHTYSSFQKTIMNEDWLVKEAYDAGIQLCNSLIDIYKDISEVVTHHELSPDRKIDPGKMFPMEKFKSDLCL